MNNLSDNNFFITCLLPRFTHWAIFWWWSAMWLSLSRSAQLTVTAAILRTLDIRMTASGTEQS